MNRFGWYHTRTGGGCTALQCDFVCGAYALLTDGNQCAPGESADEEYVVGLYSAHEDQIDAEAFDTREEAEQWLTTEIANRKLVLK